MNALVDLEHCQIFLSAFLRGERSSFSFKEYFTEVLVCFVWRVIRRIFPSLPTHDVEDCVVPYIVLFVAPLIGMAEPCVVAAKVVGDPGNR